MPKHEAMHIVSFGQKRIFDAMMDVEKYPDVLPFIKSLKIRDRSPTTVTARVAVGVGPLSFSYTCVITPMPYDAIEVNGTSGPFKKLYAKWRFHKISENETEVTCFLDSEFRSRVMELAGGQIFAHQFQHAIDVFEDHMKRQDRKNR